jgi:hypothetical protein
MPLSDLSTTIHERDEVHDWKHATAILKADFPEEWQ